MLARQLIGHYSQHRRSFLAGVAAPAELVSVQRGRYVASSNGSPIHNFRSYLAGHRVCYLTAAQLVETLYRGLADSVGRVIEQLLRAELVVIDDLGFAPLDDTAAQLLFRFAAAYERRALGFASHWPFDAWGAFAEHTTAGSFLDRLLHQSIVVTDGESYRMREARARGGVTGPKKR